MDLLNPGPQQQAQRQILTNEQIGQMHDLAAALQNNALSDKPIFSPWAGAARMADALVGNITQARQADAQRDITGYTEQQLAKTLGIPIPGQPSTALPSAPEAQSAPGAVSQNERDAIAANESGGNYGEIGPHVPATSTHPAGYALGKYQVMNYDLPGRLKDAGLPAMSESEWLANHDAQEKQFDHEFGGMRKSHSFADAASMWHSGVPLDQAIKEGRTDGHMTTQHYVQRALQHLNPVSPAGAAAGGSTSMAPSPNERVGADFAANPQPAAVPAPTLGGQPQVPTPQPRPPTMGPGAPPTPPPAPPPAAPPQAMPHVEVTPRPKGTGQPIPGTMSLQQQHAILNLIGQPATHQLGLALAQKYLLPENVNEPTGQAYFGTRAAGLTPSNEPALPQPIPGTTNILGVGGQYLPGTPPSQVNIPNIGGGGDLGGVAKSVETVLNTVGKDWPEALRNKIRELVGAGNP